MSRPVLFYLFCPNNLHIRRLRGNGRNKRGDDSSDESEEGYPDSDDDAEDTRDDTSDSVGERPLLNSEDPSATRRPGRDARARAKVIFSFESYHLC